MKVYLIKASAPGPFKEYKKAMGAPPQNIFSVAATTPAGVGISMCDETVGMKPKLNTKADIIALFFHTPDALHAYKLADKYRARGKTVVLGGLHPTFMPDEASAHADALLLGEAEGIWEQLLNDYETQTLQKIYKRENPVDLAEVKPYPTDIIPPSKYDHVWTVLVSRGCVHKCDYCTVPPFFCGKYRLRPIEDIVAEIKAAPTNYFELHADNLTANREYALNLFKALKPLKIRWSGEATIKLADDSELLKAAADSGCEWLLIGTETPSQAALSDSGKGFVDPDTIREKIGCFHEHGIHITSSMIFGFDTHTPDIFKESEQFCRHIGIDEVESVLLIPFPGTPLFNRMEKENRLLTHDWSKYDGSHAVFNPTNMTPEKLEEGAHWFWNETRKKKVSGSPAVGNQKTDSNRGRKRAGGPALTTDRKTIRWKSIVALGIIAVGIYFNWYWVWGVLAIIWAFNDLRNRHTYLLEDIPRSEAPVLYWVVVLMWLAMGIWALSTAPALSELMESGASMTTRNKQIYNTGKPTHRGHSPRIAVKDAAGKTMLRKLDLQRIKDQRFGVSFHGPVKWDLSEKNDKDSVILHLEDEKKAATITVMGMDFKARMPLESYIPYIEEELSGDLPFMETASHIVPMEPMPINDVGLRMVFRQYSGKYKSQPVVAQIGYAVDLSKGYSIIGVYGKGDYRMEAMVGKALASFRITGN